MGNLKKQFPHRWEINHWSYKNRWGDAKKKIFKTSAASIYQLEQLEDLPFFEGFKAGVRGNPCSRNLPIGRFLAKQVGRDYDEVFAEIIERIPPRYRHSGGIAELKMTKHKHSKDTHEGFNLKYSWRSDLYVSTETNLICHFERRSRKKATQEERTQSVYRPFKKMQYAFKFWYDKVVFTQLTTYEAFEKEAREMKHCVRVYWRNCIADTYKTSIWSMQGADNMRLTIQVNDKSIVQVRGLGNRLVTLEEAFLLKKWANLVGCDIKDMTVIRRIETSRENAQGSI